jgi:hypothetical protein
VSGNQASGTAHPKVSEAYETPESFKDYEFHKIYKVLKHM